MTNAFGQPFIVRLGPDLRQAVAARRGAPLPPERVAAIRKLVEETPLPFRTIARQTGVALATISRLSARHGWIRPEGASKPNLTAARRQSARLGHLAERVLGLAEEAVEHIDDGRIRATPQEVHRVLRLVRLARRVADEQAKQRVRRRRGRAE